MPPSYLHYLITSLRVRFAAVRSGELDRGALSLEWVVIAIGLSYIKKEDGNIQSP
jgi:hypothetical protein